MNTQVALGIAAVAADTTTRTRYSCAWCAKKYVRKCAFDNHKIKCCDLGATRLRSGPAAPKSLPESPPENAEAMYRIIRDLSARVNELEAAAAAAAAAAALSRASRVGTKTDTINELNDEETGSRPMVDIDDFIGLINDAKLADELLVSHDMGVEALAIALIRSTDDRLCSRFKADTDRTGDYNTHRPIAAFARHKGVLFSYQRAEGWTQMSVATLCAISRAASVSLMSRCNHWRVTNITSVGKSVRSSGEAAQTYQSMTERICTVNINAGGAGTRIRTTMAAMFSENGDPERVGADSHVFDR